MIVGLEGLSTAGKTTFIDMFLAKYPDTLRFRGAGAVNVGMQNRWQEYNFWMHNIVEQLDKLNKHEKIILWDRFLTDGVHSDDPAYRSEILRVIKSHAKKVVIYIDVPDKVLIERGTKEGILLEERKKRYTDVVSGFKTLMLKPRKENNYYITEEEVIQAHNFIMKNLK